MKSRNHFSFFFFIVPTFLQHVINTIIDNHSLLEPSIASNLNQPSFQTSVWHRNHRKHRSESSQSPPTYKLLISFTFHVAYLRTHSLAILSCFSRSSRYCFAVSALTSKTVHFNWFEQLTNICNQRIIWIRISEQRANGQQHLADGQRRTPLVLQNVQTNAARRTNVAMIDARLKHNIGRVNKERNVRQTKHNKKRENLS